MTGRVLVIGVGNRFRRDDGAGSAVIEALRTWHHRGIELAVSDGDPGLLLGLWSPADTVVVAETAHAEPSCPGRLHSLSADRAARLAMGPASTHGLGLGETVALAAALGRLPRALVIHAVEGTDFRMGIGLSAPVATALPALTRLVTASVRAAAGWQRETGEGGDAFLPGGRQPGSGCAGDLPSHE